MYVPCTVVVGEYFTSKRAVAMPLAVSGVGIFCLLLPPVLRALINLYGWRGGMLLSAGLALHGTICGALLRPLRLRVPSKTGSNSHGNNSAPCYTTLTITSNNNSTTSSTRHIITPDTTPINNTNSNTNSNNTNSNSNNIAATSSPRCHASLFHNPTFWLFFTNQVLWNAGSLIFVLLVADYAKEAGQSRERGAWLLAGAGVTGTVGRVVTAGLGKYVNRLALYNSATLMSGLFIALVPLAVPTFGVFAVSACGYGVCLGLQASLLGVLTVDLFSVQHLNSAYGYLIVSNGIGALIGPPIAGEGYAKGRACEGGVAIKLVILQFRYLLYFFIFPATFHYLCSPLCIVF
jgi:MCP family monocarboxylic acid transporter-like MFS transporter 12